ncbi:MAG: endonuclease III domain-containing protein [Gemmatimonadales bacterium]
MAIRPEAHTATPLRAVVRTLARQHGAPPRPFPTDPFQQILWVNVAYLADDARRRAAFDLLRREVGLAPEEVLHAPVSVLRRVTSHGIMADRFAGKLYETARLATERFDGDLSAVVRRPARDAIRALRTFPGIGEPGAEKILLFAARQPLLAPDSNALRVLQRLGLVPARGGYAAVYAAARRLATRDLVRGIAAMQRAHVLLRHHGIEVCTRSHPACDRCALRLRCPRIGVPR